MKGQGSGSASAPSTPVRTPPTAQHVCAWIGSSPARKRVVRLMLAAVYAPPAGAVMYRPPCTQTAMAPRIQRDSSAHSIELAAGAGIICVRRCGIPAYGRSTRGVQSLPSPAGVTGHLHTELAFRVYGYEYVCTSIRCCTKRQAPTISCCCRGCANPSRRMPQSKTA